MPDFNASEWYWKADDGRIYSSAAQALVEEDDHVFTAWTEEGRAPTRWPENDAGAQTDIALAAVLQPYGLALWPAGAESTDPNDYPLNKFQFEALVLAMGLSLSALEEAIGKLPLSSFDKAVALSRLRNAISFNRDHPLVEQVRAQIDMSVAELDTAWMRAKGLR